MLTLWLIFTIVSVADLILTGMYLDPSLEANPIAAWIWSTFGYPGLAVFKVSIIFLIIYPSVKHIEKRRKGVAILMMLFAITVTTITCLLFGVNLL